MIEYFSTSILAIASIFLFSSSVGGLRFPDIFTRIHAAGVSDSAGVPLLLVGLICKAGWSLISLKLGLLILLIVLTNPTATHILARLSYHKIMQKKL